MNTRSFRLLALSCITIDMVREIAFVLFLMLTPPCYYTVIPVTSHVLEIRLEDKLSSALADNALSVYRFLFARLHNGVTELSAMYSCAHVHSSLGLTCAIWMSVSNVTCETISAYFLELLN